MNHSNHHHRKKHQMDPSPDFWAPYPYPTSKSPLEGITAAQEPEWLHAALTDPVFAHPSFHPSTSEARKFLLLQRTFWPALASWVEARQEVGDGGEIFGGWSRADMYGMMDWYRLCFHMTSRYEDAVAAHRDGIWRTVVLTSPWWDWPEFAHLFVETVRDEHGVPLRDEMGRVRRVVRDPYDDRMEDEFMDVWERAANSRPLRRHRDGRLVMMMPWGENRGSKGGKAAKDTGDAISGLNVPERSMKMPAGR